MAMGNQINPNLNFGGPGGQSIIDNSGQNSASLQSINNSGNATELEEITVRGSSYNFEECAYPEGIGSDMDKMHYIRFFVNMRGKSKFLEGSKSKEREGKKFKIAAEDAEFQKLRSQQGRILSTEKGNLQETGLVTSGGRVGLVVAAAIGIANRSGLGSLLGSGAGFAAGSQVGEKAAELTKKGAELFQDIREDVPRRITDVVTLHIQDRPTVNYSVGYTEDEVGILGGLLAGSDVSNINNLEDLGELAKQVGAPAALQLLNTIGGLGGSLGGTLNTRRLLESGIKNRTNPFREQFFERVDFRTFNFRHTFMPKNLGEVNQVKKIIDLFKFHMHPELVGEKNLMFLYPSEFDIKYMFEGEENNYFNKFTTCVLEDMNVEYGGDIFATFERGQPVEVNMSLRFKEIELLTKENIDSRGL